MIVSEESKTKHEVRRPSKRLERLIEEVHKENQDKKLKQSKTAPLQIQQPLKERSPQHSLERMRPPPLEFGFLEDEDDEARRKKKAKLSKKSSSQPSLGAAKPAWKIRNFSGGAWS